MFLCLQFLVMGRKYSKLCVLRLFSYNSLFKFIEWLSGGGSAPKWASIADGRQANNCILYGNAMETKGGSIKRLFVIADGIQWSNWISKMVSPSRDWRKKNPSCSTRLPSGLSIRQTFLHSSCIFTLSRINKRWNIYHILHLIVTQFQGIKSRFLQSGLIINKIVAELDKDIVILVQ